MTSVHSINSKLNLNRKKWFGNTNNQEANLYNKACSDGAALAINNSCFGDANAVVCSQATNANYVCQNQKNY